MSQSSQDALNRIEMSPNLQASLQRAIGYAYEQSHRTVTLEHVLLALAEDREAAPILEASSVALPDLVADVSDYLGHLDDRLPPDGARQPVMGDDVQHIIQSAAAAAHKGGRRGISSALALAAIVGDGRSPAANMLRNRGLTFENAISALKRVNASPPAQVVPAPTPVIAPATAAPDLGPAETPATIDPDSNPGLALPPRGGSSQDAQQILADVRKRIEATRGNITAAPPGTNIQPRPEQTSPELPAPVTEPSAGPVLAEPISPAELSPPAEPAPPAAPPKPEPAPADTEIRSPVAEPPAQVLAIDQIEPAPPAPRSRFNVAVAVARRALA